MKRSELREHIFKLLFGIEFRRGADFSEQIESYTDGEMKDASDREQDYVKTKVQKIADQTDVIDELINRHTTGWKTSRMNKVDLTILRLAVYEMKWDDSVPVGAAINEAVELAKKYSSDEGPAFVNGVLAKLAD